MKKNSILPLLAFLLSMGGCQFDSGRETVVPTEENGHMEDVSIKPEVEMPEIVTVSGFIKKNTPNSLMPDAGYILEDRKKQLFFLKSTFEDLGQYVDAGRVEVKGEKQNSAGSEIPLINVHTIQLLVPKPEIPSVLSSSDFGATMVLPADWVFTEEKGKIELFPDKNMDTAVVTFEKFALDSEQGKGFAAEMEAGTEISVENGKRAFRFLRDNALTDIFVLLPNDVLRIRFTGSMEEKAAFYDILLSLKFPDESIPETGKMCGGIAGFSCPEGQRCELEGDYPDAAGICVPAVNEETDPTEKLPEAQKKETPEKEPLPPVTEPPTKPIPPENTAPTPETTKPETTQEETSAEISEAEGSAEYRLYESTYYNFSVEYNKNWYYAHLGSVDDTISTVVFSDAPILEDVNARIRVEILDEPRTKEIVSATEIILPRDENSHFRLSASSEAFRDDLKHMADTLVSTL